MRKGGEFWVTDYLENRGGCSGGDEHTLPLGT